MSESKVFDGCDVVELMVQILTKLVVEMLVKLMVVARGSPGGQCEEARKGEGKHGAYCHKTRPQPPHCGWNK